jgi:hypothetical protein
MNSRCRVEWTGSSRCDFARLTDLSDTIGAASRHGDGRLSNQSKRTAEKAGMQSASTCPQGPDADRYLSHGSTPCHSIRQKCSSTGRATGFPKGNLGRHYLARKSRRLTVNLNPWVAGSNPATFAEDAAGLAPGKPVCSNLLARAECRSLSFVHDPRRFDSFTQHSQGRNLEGYPQKINPFNAKLALRFASLRGTS